MEIFDTHAHIYPEKIAKKATDAIGRFYSEPMEALEGTADILIKNGRESGIGRFVVHSVATAPHQVRSINSFILSEVKKHPAELIGFITLHPDLTEAELDLEVRLALENGLQGVKLHPDFQRFDIDGEDAEKIYKAVGDKLPILFHTGDDRYDYSSPERLVRAAKAHPEVRFIAAHFGAYRVWERAEIYRGIPNIWFDTSSSLAYISPERARELIDILGIDRFFFATDFPMWRASEELERFYKIPLSDTEREMILGGNIRKFLGI